MKIIETKYSTPSGDADTVGITHSSSEETRAKPLRATFMTQEEAVLIAMNAEKESLGVIGMNSIAGILTTASHVNFVTPDVRAIFPANLVIGAPEGSLFF